MSPKYHAARLQDCLQTIQMLGEALADNDDCQGCEPGPQLTIRGVAGMHGAIRLIARMASDECDQIKCLMAGARPS